MQVNHFADTETVIFVDSDSREKINGQKVFINCKFSPIGNRPINDQLFDLFVLASRVRSLGAREIVAVLPYLPYSRQAKDGGFRLIGNFFKESGIDSIFCCEVHDAHSSEYFDLTSVSLAEFWRNLLADNLGEKILSDLCVASPDKGGTKRAEALASVLGVSFVAVDKKRIGKDKSVAIGLSGEVEGKVVVLVDDIIDTGITAVNAAEILLENGATDVFACFAHPVLSGGALDRLKNSKISKIWVTNSFIHEGLSDYGINVVDFDSFIKKQVDNG